MSADENSSIEGESSRARAENSFVEGNDNCIEYSGGTGIYKDNEFNKPIFIPTTLNNSCLIYDSSENFFHGFKRMKPEGYRKAITFAFMSDK